MGKSISKAFKKVIGGALNTVGLGQDAPQVAAQEVQAPAAPTEVPQEQVEVIEDDSTPSAAKKATRAGKRGLQVSRTSGGGISL